MNDDNKHWSKKSSIANITIPEGGEISVSVTQDCSIYERQLKEWMDSSKVNILVMGHSGSGKTTLIRLVLGVTVGDSRPGLPVTQSFLKYEDVSGKICLYDSKGLEVGEEAAKMFWLEHKKFLYEHMNALDAQEMIHVIWYIINASESRIVEEDFRLMKELYKRTTVIICLNKVDIVSENDRKVLKETIKQRVIEMGLNNVYHQIFEIISNRQGSMLDSCPECGTKAKGKLMVSATEDDDKGLLSWYCKVCKGEGNLPRTTGLESLITATVDALDEHVRSAFIGAQEICTEQKDSRAETIIRSGFSDVKTGFTKNENSVEVVTKRTMIELAKLWNFNISCKILIDKLDTEPWFPTWFHRFGAAVTGWWEGEPEAKFCLTATCVSYYRLIRVLSHATCQRVSLYYKSIGKELFFNDQSSEGVAFQNEILKLDKSEHLSALIVHYFHSLIQYQYACLLTEWKENALVSHLSDNNEKFNVLFEEGKDTLKKALYDWSPCQVSEDGTIIPLDEPYEDVGELIMHTVERVGETLKEKKRSSTRLNQTV